MATARGSGGGAAEALRCLTVGEVAEALRVDRKTVYRLVRSGALGGVHVGRALRVPCSAVATYLAARTVAVARPVASTSAARTSSSAASGGTCASLVPIRPSAPCTPGTPPRPTGSSLSTLTDVAALRRWRREQRQTRCR